MASFLQDVRYALRQLGRSPGFAIAAILTLGLGIGANTAIFSVVNGLLLRPPGGIEDFGALVSIYTSDYSGPAWGASSLPDVLDFNAGAPALSGVAAYTVSPVVLSDAQGELAAEMVLGQVVTPNFFTVLGARPIAGRPFTGDEGSPGGRNDVVVLAHDFWQTHFQGDPGIVGRAVRLGGVPYTVIGVASPEFSGLLPGLSPAFFVPVGAPGLTDPDLFEQRGSRSFFTFGRLTGSATVEQAVGQLQSVAAGLHRQYPDAWTDIQDQPRRVSVIPAAQATVPPQLRGPVAGFVALLMAIVAGVLLIGCVNIANLLLARATGRRREIAVRVAIGAGRGRLIRQLLTESMVLAALGAILGLFLAVAGTRALILISTSLPLPVTVRLHISPDLRVLGFAALVAIVAGALFGLAPALLSTRRSVASSMIREDGGGRRLGLRAVLAAGQITIAMVLLVAGGLLVRSLLSAQSIDPGFRPDGLLSVSLAMDENSKTPEQRVLFQHELAERVRGLPGVADVSYVSSLPLSAGNGRRSFSIEGYRPADNEDMEIHWSDAGPNYFRTMGTRLSSGREFTEADALNAPRTAIVNEAFARHYLPGQNPLGKRLGGGGSDPLVIEIIGVAETGKYVSLGEDPLPFVWLAADQRPPSFVTLVVRGSSNTAALAQPIRRLVADVDPDAAVTTVALANQHLSFALLPQKIGAWMLGLFGLLGLALAALGIYGVMAYAVNQRTREFGVRLALGARTQDVTRMVLRQGMIVAAIGGVIGLGLAAAVTRLMGFLLFDVKPLDPTTFATVAAIVFGVALLANWLPARRTAKVDPLKALRYD
jgi:putative ABC transport system permease protein